MSSLSRSRAGLSPRRAARSALAVLVVVALAGCGGAEPLGLEHLDGPAPGQQAGGADVDRGLVTGDGAWRLLLDGVDGLAVADGVVYVATPAGLYALDAASGRMVWDADLSSDGPVDLAVDGDVLGYWSSWAGETFAVAVATGEVLPDEPVGPPPDPTAEPGSVTLDGTVVERAADGGAVTAHDAAGEERWRFAPDDGAVNAGPVAAGGWVLVGTFETLYALDASDGTVAWSIDDILQSYDSGPLVVEDGWAFAGLADGSVMGVDLSTAAPPGLAAVRAWQRPDGYY